MQKIEVIVRRSVTEHVRDALTQHGVEMVMMTDLRATPPVGSPPSVYRGATYVADVPQTKVEAVVADADVTAVVRAIVAAARTGGRVDGRILVVPIAGVISIATGMTWAVRRGPRHGKRPRLRPVDGSVDGADGRPARDG
jgi:nitrogen regulatory protein PII